MVNNPADDSTAPVAPSPVDETAQTAGRAAVSPRAQQMVRPLGNPVLLAVLLLAGVAGWQWYAARQQLVQQQQVWEKRLLEADTAVHESRSALRQLQEQNQVLGTRLGGLEGQLEQAGIAQAVSRDLAANRDLAVLAEMEHVLVLALQQLQVSAEVSTALGSLQRVDNRLALMDRVPFSGVRKALAHDIERLRKVPVIDLAGMSQRLEGILVGVDHWPFAMEARPVVTRATPFGDETTPGAALLNGLWSEIRGLIRIERMEGAAPVLLSADQAFFVRENLKLRLLSARLSLMARDQNSFRHELENSLGLLKRHFNRVDKTVQNAEGTLQQMLVMPLQAELPNLAESLSALRHAQQQIEKKSLP